MQGITGQSASISGMVMQQIILGTISKCVEDENVTGSSEHGFTKHRSCLTIPVAFCSALTGSEHEQRAVRCLS